jgi:3,4-dihydroxy 2-butanone 4-phosphate synthase/GTP cyclohydrolase II
VGINPANAGYLETKRDRMGHRLVLDTDMPIGPDAYPDAAAPDGLTTTTATGAVGARPASPEEETA